MRLFFESIKLAVIGLIVGFVFKYVDTVSSSPAFLMGVSQYGSELSVWILIFIVLAYKARGILQSFAFPFVFFVSFVIGYNLVSFFKGGFDRNDLILWSIAIGLTAIFSVLLYIFHRYHLMENVLLAVPIALLIANSKTFSFQLNYFLSLPIISIMIILFLYKKFNLSDLVTIGLSTFVFFIIQLYYPWTVQSIQQLMQQAIQFIASFF